MTRPPARAPRHRQSILTSKYITKALASCGEVLRRAGLDPDPALLRSISVYIELLLRWNAKINLTAITDPQEIVSRNFAESFLALRFLESPAGQLADIGSGAGFPGLALKLVLPVWSAKLIESSRKKAAFLSEAARTLHLDHVTVECARWQESKIPPASLDAITSRALGDYEALAGWSRSKLNPGGKLLLWVGAGEADRLRSLAEWNWQTVAVPDSRERVLLVGTPTLSVCT